MSGTEDKNMRKEVAKKKTKGEMRENWMKISWSRKSKREKSLKKHCTPRLLTAAAHSDKILIN